MHRLTQSEEARALAKEFSTPARGLLSIQQGDKIAETLLFSKELYLHKFNELKLQKAIRSLLEQAVDANEPLDLEKATQEACRDMGLDPAWAVKYFNSPRYARWLNDRVQEIEENAGVTIKYLLSLEMRNIRGEIALSSSQHQSLERVEKRVWPEISRIDHTIQQKEAVTLDNMPDYQKKVEDLEAKLKAKVTDDAA